MFSLFMRSCVVGLIACLVSQFATVGIGQESNGWMYGASKTVITPKDSMWMAGYGSRDRPAEGTLTDLWAKSLVLQDAEGNRCVLITLDLVGIDRGWSQSVTERIADEHGFERSEIAINTSHTHTGPVVGMNLRPMHYMLLPPEETAKIDDYSEHLQNQVVELVGAASENLSPAEITYGQGEATFAVNRRNNRPESDVPNRRTDGTLEGPIDHDVPVLAVRDVEGQLRVVVFGYACHATVLSFLQWSGDYPGFAQMEIETRFQDCQAMFWAGCGADQNPLPRRSVSLAMHYGRRLADAVESVLLTSQMQSIDPMLQTEYAEVDLPFDQIPSLQEWESIAENGNAFHVARAKMFVEQLAAGEEIETSYPYPIQRWWLGEQVEWIFLGGEVCVEFSINLKNLSNNPMVWIAGYSNDVMAYIPSRRVWVEGGYEGADAMVYYGLPARWTDEVEEIIIRHASRPRPDR